MLAEVIAIGDELTSGQRLDTNSQWLSQRLEELGVEVMFHSTVGDDLAANTQVFRQAIERADVVVSTGGLGPTADDLTRQALAAAMNVGLVRDEVLLKHIETLFAARGREMPPRNALQADFPAGALPISNPHGTAPGIEATISRRTISRPTGGACHFFALPGVPVEMHAMWSASVGPAIAKRQAGQQLVIVRRAIKLFGPGESQLEAMLGDLLRRDRQPRVGITVSGATLTLRIMAAGTNRSTCESALQETVQEIEELVGEYIFGEGEEELEHAVLRELAAGGQTLATSEVFSQGMLAGWLAEADREGAIYRGGMVLNQPEQVSDRESTLAQAEAVRQQYAASYGLALSAVVNGEAGAGEKEPSQSDQVYVAIAGEGEPCCERLAVRGDLAVVRSRLAKTAMNLLRLTLRGPKGATGVVK